MTRAAWKIELLSETALSRSSRPVISIVNACRAGMSNAIAMPFTVDKAMMSAGVARPHQASPARTKAGSICTACAQMTMVRFG